MSKKIISIALLAAASGTSAYAQTNSQDSNGYSGYQSAPQQQYDSSAPQYYNYQGEQTSSPSSYQDQNGQYIDHSASEMRGNQPNNFARDLKDGPMGTSPGA